MKTDIYGWISKKNTSEILKEGVLKPNGMFNQRTRSANLKTKIYNFPDGRIFEVDTVENQGRIWPNVTEYDSFLTKIEGMSYSPRHVLDQFTISVNMMPNEIPALLTQLRQELDFDTEFVKGDHRRLDVLNKRLHSYGISKARKMIFIPLMAYCGEVMRLETGGQWEMKFDEESGIYEPYVILDSGRTFNPWLNLFKEFEENPDRFNIRAVVEAEIGKYKLIDSGLQQAHSENGIRNIPVEEALRLLADAGGEVDQETKSLMQSIGMDGLPIRFPNGQYLIRQTTYHFPFVPLFESKKAIEDYLQLQMQLIQVQDHIPIMYSLEEAVLTPELVRHLYLTVSDLESRPFDPEIFSNLEYLAVTNEGWTVFPPVGIDMDLPVVNWSILSRFTSLKTLNLSGVPIASLPKQIQELRNLETLQILYVQPRNIGREISRLQQLRKLKVLDLEGSIFEPGQQGRIVDALGAIDVVQSSITLQDTGPAQDRDE